MSQWLFIILVWKKNAYGWSRGKCTSRILDRLSDTRQRHALCITSCTLYETGNFDFRRACFALDLSVQAQVLNYHWNSNKEDLTGDISYTLVLGKYSVWLLIRIHKATYRRKQEYRKDIYDNSMQMRPKKLLAAICRGGLLTSSSTVKRKETKWVPEQFTNLRRKRSCLDLKQVLQRTL